MFEEQIKNLYSVLSEYSADMADDFLYTPDDEKEAWLKKNIRTLESLDGFTEKYKGVQGLFEDKMKALTGLYQDQTAYWDKTGEVPMPTEERIAQFQKEHPSISKREITEWFKKTNDFAKLMKAEQTKQIGQARREREVAGWEKEKNPFNKDFWRDVLTSEYEKKRYIDDPSSAIFGKEAPGFFGSSAGAKADLLTGGAAAALDFVPNKFVAWAGPAIRAGRDVAHIADDSPYQKDPSILAAKAGGDLMLNYTTLGLANTRRAARVASNLAPENVLVENERRAIVNGIKSINEGHIIGFSKSPSVTIEAIKKLPDSPMKTEMLALFGKDALKKEVPNQELLAIKSKYAIASDPIMISGERAASKYGPIFQDEVFAMPDWSTKAVTQEPLTRMNKVEAGLLRGLNQINLGAPGYVGFQGVRAIGDARPTGNVNIVETSLRKKEWDDMVEKTIKDFSSIWSKDRKPLGYNLPLIKEAYNKWLEEQE